MSKFSMFLFGRNHLIHSMSPEDRAAIEPHLKLVALERQQVLETANEPVETVYFPVSGIGSMLALGDRERRIDVGLFGCEGMSGTAIVMGTDRSPHEVVMQVGGQGFAIGADRFRGLMEVRAAFRKRLFHFVQVLATQTAQTALSNGQFTLKKRLARWLLMCHDRVGGDEIELTHEYLSIMLGVRRAGVTVGMRALGSEGMVRATRGRITILDREGLEALASASYGVPEREYERIIG